MCNHRHDEPRVALSMVVMSAWRGGGGRLHRDTHYRGRPVFLSEGSVTRYRAPLPLRGPWVEAL